MGEIREKLLPVFLQEASENLPLMERVCSALSREEKLDSKEIEEAFRAAHTIKGTAALVGFEDLSQAAYALEQAFASINTSGQCLAQGEVVELAAKCDFLVRGITRAEAGPSSGLESTEEEGPQEQIRPACCQFNVGGQLFYLPIEDMTEISELSAMTPLPMAPDYVRGLFQVQGEAVPVIDLAQIMGVVISPEKGRRLVVARAGEEMLAFLVDGMPELSPVAKGRRLNVADFIRRYAVKAS